MGKRREKILNEIKFWSHLLIPIEGQRYYCKNTDMPKPLAAITVTGYQMAIYTSAVYGAAQLLK